MKPFREHFEQLAAFALVELGLTRDELQKYTPREWNFVEKAWEKREERANRRVARIILAIAVGNGAKNVTEDDFLPKPTEPDSTEDLLAAFVLATGSAPPNYGST